MLSFSCLFLSVFTCILFSTFLSVLHGCTCSSRPTQLLKQMQRALEDSSKNINTLLASLKQGPHMVSLCRPLSYPSLLLSRVYVCTGSGHLDDSIAQLDGKIDTLVPKIDLIAYDCCVGPADLAPAQIFFCPH